MIKFALLIGVFSTLSMMPQGGSGGVSVVKSYTQNVMGKNIGYYVELKNNSGKTIDAIEWQASFYNNFNDLKGRKIGDWSSGNIIKPVKPGEVIKDLEGVWVDGATKVEIEITRVHYTNGKTWTSK
jgi:hypothetical protein